MKKEKIFNLVGQAVLYIGFISTWVGILAVGFLQNTIF